MITITHKKNRHWATLKSRWNVLRLLWSKKKNDTYTIRFRPECLSAPANAYNKILGTSQFLNPRKKSLRLAWKPTGAGMISIAEMHEVNETIQFRVIGMIVPNQNFEFTFEKKYRFQINTPYFGGNQTPTKTLKYYIK